MRRTVVIEKANNYIRLTDYRPEFVSKILVPFCKRNLYRIQKVPGEIPGTFVWKATHVFARFNNDKTELRFNSNMLELFLKFMVSCGFDRSRALIKEAPVINPVKVNFTTKFDLKPRNEDQEEYCEFMKGPLPLVVNNASTGMGKTVMAIMTMVSIGERVLITVLPRYIDIWLKAIDEFLKVKPEDVLVADITPLEKLNDCFVEGIINPKIIILPLTRIDVYLKKMRENPNIPHLDEIIKNMAPGVRIVDEAHESIYSIYMSLMFGNVKKTIALSATLKGDDHFINEMYNNIFPSYAYLKDAVYTKYMHVIGYMHRMDINKYRINTQGFGGYSHNKFEKAMLKRPAVFEKYYQLCKQAFVDYYVSTYLEGQKFMWFFGTIDFCNAFHKRLLQDYPDMDIITFTSEMSKKKDQKDEYRKHQGVITTPGSCGTGKDVAMLKIVFSGIAVSSSQRNKQMVGRTRPINKWWPDLDPIFLYLICLDIPKQVEYHRKRKNLFDPIMKKFSLIDSNFHI